MADKKMKMQELEVPDQYGGKRTVKFYGDLTEEQARENWAKHLERQEARRKRRMEREMERERDRNRDIDRERNRYRDRE